MSGVTSTGAISFNEVSESVDGNFFNAVLEKYLEKDIPVLEKSSQKYA